MHAISSWWGAGGVGEGDLFVDNWGECVVLQAGDYCGVDLGEFFCRGVAEGHAQDGQVAGHGQARVDFDFAAAADDDDTAARGQDGKVGGEVFVGEHFKDEIGAAVIGEGRDFVEVVGDAVVQNVMSPLLLDEFQACFRAGGADDDQAGGFGELDGGQAYATAGTVDQNSFTGLSLAADEQGAVGGAIWGRPMRSAPIVEREM